MMYSAAQRELAHRLLETEAIRRKHQSPEGKGFRLKLHEKHPDAPLSPIYIDLRRLRSFPDAREWVTRVLRGLCQGLTFDVLADVPTAATPFVVLLAHEMRIPMITPREPKTHGAGGSIDGHAVSGQTALLIDDLITSAGSKFEAIRTLEAHGLRVHDVVVLIDREQGGTTVLQQAGYSLHAVFTLRALLEFYLENSQMGRGEYDEVMTYLGTNP